MANSGHPLVACAVLLKVRKLPGGGTEVTEHGAYSFVPLVVDRRPR